MSKQILITTTPGIPARSNGEGYEEIRNRAPANGQALACGMAEART